MVVKWIGGLYLLYLGIRLLRARRRFDIAGGTLLSAAGIWVLLARRPL